MCVTQITFWYFIIGTDMIKYSLFDCHVPYAWLSVIKWKDTSMMQILHKEYQWFVLGNSSSTLTLKNNNNIHLTMSAKVHSHQNLEQFSPILNKTQIKIYIYKWNLIPFQPFNQIQYLSIIHHKFLSTKL